MASWKNYVKSPLVKPLKKKASWKDYATPDVLSSIGIGGAAGLADYLLIQDPKKRSLMRGLGVGAGVGVGAYGAQKLYNHLADKTPEEHPNVAPWLDQVMRARMSQAPAGNEWQRKKTDTTEKTQPLSTYAKDVAAFGPNSTRHFMLDTALSEQALDRMRKINPNSPAASQDADNEVIQLEQARRMLPPYDMPK